MLSTDPIDLALDPVTGDLAFTGGALTLTSGTAAVTQGARIRLRLIAGEWFADRDAGVPYLERDGVTADQALLGQKFSAAKVSRAIRRALLVTPGVDAVPQLAVDYDGRTRAASVTWQVRTAFGDTAADSLALGR